ncbi:MAG TPA: hypothetical protein DSN98_07755 [Thermoplasmata archaeon]|nr:MAG TPA: hypothetical protein DSN98_07755 [Thermoplasmata archaeon]
MSGFFSEIAIKNINYTPIKNDRNVIPNKCAEGDFDPLVDIEVTVNIISIRTLVDHNTHDSPDFFVKVLINSEEFLSPLWLDSPYLYNINWTATANVPDDIEYVDVIIELYKKTTRGENLCDISKEQNTKTEGFTAEMFYNIKTDHWTGDDFVGDSSGYGRLNGYDDGRFDECEQDCELWFNIDQNEYDGDHIPYWTEVYVYRTDPTFNNTGDDLDRDGLPIEWEHKWMYSPIMWDDHARLDPDNDSLTNAEEYRVSSWGSDPYRRDIYIEIDIMAEGPLGQNSSISAHTKELLRTVFDRRNIVFHLDDGCMGGGGEILPFDRKTIRDELKTLYNTYFLHNDSENWRIGIFRYAMIIHEFTASGMAYVGDHPWLYWHAQGSNTFVISAKTMQKTSIKSIKPIDYVFACAMMHETGHMMSIDFMFPIGCDMKRSIHPRNLAFWLFGNYKSCMNYRYVYAILDYSDGSHGLFDHDDWSNLDFSFFEKKNVNS